MPPKSKQAVSRPSKKASKQKRRLENNTDVHHYTVALSGSYAPVQGITVSNYIYTYWSPSPNLSITPTQSHPLFNATEFTLYRNMYDQFRVKSIRVKLVPRYKTLEATAMITGEAAAGAGAHLTMGKGVVYTCEDRDGIVPSSIATMRRLPSCKTHSIFKTITRTYTTDKPTQWFDCQDPAGLFDIQRSIGYNGGITIYGESFPEINATLFNEPWYDVEVHYNLVFRGKTPIRLGLSGTSVYISQNVVAPELPVPAKVNAEGVSVGAVDLSGNTIG